MRVALFLFFVKSLLAHKGRLKELKCHTMCRGVLPKGITKGIIIFFPKVGEVENLRN
jgi:hypothetical protein